jgi:molybdopterin-containing oxidoreductase family membrane subunit
MLVGFAYGMEFFIAWYSGNQFERHAFQYNRVTPDFIDPKGAPYWWAYWTMICCNVLSPQVFWFSWARRSPIIIFIVSVLITIGMWFERFVIIVTSLHRAFLPGEWHMFWPTLTDIMIFVGSFGVFMTLFLLFLRFMPVFAMAELKAVLPQADPHGHHDGHGHGHDHAHSSHADKGGH